MNAITPLSSTAETVTLRRADFEALIRAAEDARDTATFIAHEKRVAEEGIDAVRVDVLPAALMQRLLAGEPPVRVWRERRGLSQRALAAKAGISAGFLNDIEAGRRSGGVATVRRIAAALSVEIADLLPED